MQPPWPLDRLPGTHSQLLSALQLPSAHPDSNKASLQWPGAGVGEGDGDGDGPGDGDGEGDLPLPHPCSTNVAAKDATTQTPRMAREEVSKLMYQST
mmetsp:Transcript_9721/g.23148  ORF Transcript_9721/g.23148 Transcript_9721/m.23148 type:complete len:97 (+) Transcript_9721:939-1229(+)